MGKKGKNRRNQDGEPSNEGPSGQQQQQPQQQQQHQQQQQQPQQQQRQQPQQQQQQQSQQQQRQPQQQRQQPVQQQQGYASDIVQGQGRGGRGGQHQGDGRGGRGGQSQEVGREGGRGQGPEDGRGGQHQGDGRGGRGGQGGQHQGDGRGGGGGGRGGQSQEYGRGGRGGQGGQHQGDGRGGGGGQGPEDGRGGQSQEYGRGGRGGRGGQSQGDGRGGRGGRGGQSQGDGRGRGQTTDSGGDNSKPSPAESRAASADSRASVGKPKGPMPAIAGSSPVKTSLSVAQQAMYRAQIPKRKNANKAGTAGRPITVETNMIPILFGKNFCKMVTHYDVKLDPDKPKFMYRPVVEAVRLQHYPQRHPAFDGRCNLYAAGTLPFGEQLHATVEVENPQRQKTMSFKVTITKAREIDMSWLPHVQPGLEENEREQTAIQALDVVLRAAAIRQKAVMVGRSFFTEPEPGRVVDLGSGMDLWVGSFQSAVLGWKPYFNIDVAHKAFPRSQKVLDLIQELCGDPRSNRPITVADIDNIYNRKKLTSFLKGLKVTYEIPGHPSSRRTWNINDLGRSARQATFELQDGSVTTVENYFATEKRYRIRFPDYPTLWVGPRTKTLLIPIELCVIEAGQVTNAKLDERQTSTMIKYAATNTATRKQKIMDGFSKLRMNQDPTVNEFGVSVGTGFEKVPARVLNPPALFDKREISVSKGVWRQNAFYTASVLPEKSWTILNLNDRTTEAPLRNLVQLLRNRGRSVGMDIGEPLTPFKYMKAPLRDVREIVQFYQEKKAEGIKLIIVIVPDKTGPVYGKVKQNAELNVGVLTQCLKAVTVERKMNDATAGNIILKINAKLNGTNQIFAAGRNPPCLNTPCMIVGADVTHPSPDSVGIPSIAAVAASHGPRAFKYNVKIRLQPPRTEIILHLETIMREQLLFFYKNTGHKPARIIFYRDGVSEGQFPQVMHHELQAIRNACAKLGGATKYEPKITFLVVQKRHHIRLFPTDQRNSDDRNGNVQAGTVVDTQITHPSHIDFYLVSHASIQGTARPTKYRCLWDDSDMSEDEIEQLTYYLCHMFSRCTRSVSYPAPTYYAHLAAFRARALTNEVDIRLNNLEEEQRTRMTIKDEILTGNPMFFV